MELFGTIRTRRTVRKYTFTPVPCEALEQIVDAGRLSASGNNYQPHEFVVVTQPDVLRRLRFPADRLSGKAGALIAVVIDPETRWCDEDGAAAVQNMPLACTALGLGACWMEGYTLRNEEANRSILGIPPVLVSRLRRRIC